MSWSAGRSGAKPRVSLPLVAHYVPYIWYAPVQLGALAAIFLWAAWSDILHVNAAPWALVLFLHRRGGEATRGDGAGAGRRPRAADVLFWLKSEVSASGSLRQGRARRAHVAAMAVASVTRRRRSSERVTRDRRSPSYGCSRCRDGQSPGASSGRPPPSGTRATAPREPVSAPA